MKKTILLTILLTFIVTNNGFSQIDDLVYKWVGDLKTSDPEWIAYKLDSKIKTFISPTDNLFIKWHNEETYSFLYKRKDETFQNFVKEKNLWRKKLKDGKYLYITWLKSDTPISPFLKKLGIE